ncbi:hypothetical protein GCM10011579_006910 [Streptomyces albiflavescens]|uniref:Hydrogenase n=2 Tax=Streptomyces albiflavescens TaxID=1623582 RepID=A0A918CZA9_9ACTN|nr:hypothetical protein GCM10011579_006910 [Streptomyces albiflavescens]
MLRATLSRSQVRLHAVQSLLVSGLSVIVAGERVTRLRRDAQVEIAGSGALGVASATLLALALSLALAGFGFFAVGSLDIRSRFLPHTSLGLSVAIVPVAFVLMIVRRDVVSQAVTFFSLENGVSLASLVVAAGIPMIIEVAFLFDPLVAMVVFDVLMRVHHHRTKSLSTESLTLLRG